MQQHRVAKIYSCCVPLYAGARQCPAECLHADCRNIYFSEWHEEQSPCTQSKRYYHHNFS